MELLTEAEALKLFYDNKYAAFLKALRERGMIAPEPEPVDPLLIEAREICVKCFTSRNYSQTVIDRLADNDTVVQIALTALRRNLAMAGRQTLTREMVRDVVEIAGATLLTSKGYVDTIYAGLVERLK